MDGRESQAHAPPVYGSAGRIGLVVPANNSVIEPELNSALPPQVAAYATRIRARGKLTPEAVRAMEKDVDAAVDTLASTGVDVIAYCDMVTTFIMEPGWNEDAVARFRTSTGVPAISAWTALRDALATLQIRRLALGTPYPKRIHEAGVAFFRARGFEVASEGTLDILAMSEVPTVDRRRLLAFVASLQTSGCDGLVLLATDLPTYGVLAELEEEIGIPVLGSNQTLLWSALSILGQRPTRPLGRLFSH